MITKQFILKDAPDAKLNVSNFELQEVELPELVDGEVLVRNILLSIELLSNQAIHLFVLGESIYRIFI